jgi:hypothetical protein
MPKILDIAGYANRPPPAIRPPQTRFDPPNSGGLLDCDGCLRRATGVFGGRLWVRLSIATH